MVYNFKKAGQEQLTKDYIEGTSRPYIVITREQRDNMIFNLHQLEKTQAPTKESFWNGDDWINIPVCGPSTEDEHGLHLQVGLSQLNIENSLEDNGDNVKTVNIGSQVVVNANDDGSSDVEEIETEDIPPMAEMQDNWDSVASSNPKTLYGQCQSYVSLLSEISRLSGGNEQIDTEILNTMSSLVGRTREMLWKLKGEDVSFQGEFVSLVPPLDKRREAVRLKRPSEYHAKLQKSKKKKHQQTT